MAITNTIIITVFLVLSLPLITIMVPYTAEPWHGAIILAAVNTGALPGPATYKYLRYLFALARVPPESLSSRPPSLKLRRQRRKRKNVQLLKMCYTGGQNHFSATINAPLQGGICQRGVHGKFHLNSLLLIAQNMLPRFFFFFSLLSLLAFFFFCCC